MVSSFSEPLSAQAKNPAQSAHSKERINKTDSIRFIINNLLEISNDYYMPFRVEKQEMSPIQY